MELKKLIILFGSETGTAQDVAERIWREAKTRGLKAHISSMDEYDITNLIYEEVVIFVCSTTGQGDTPSNMKNFWKFLLRKNLPSTSLATVQFSVLALGDSSYVKFNHAGKKLYKRLKSLGGRDLIPLGLADDQHDLGPDAVTDPWISSLWLALEGLYSVSAPVSTNLPLTRWNVKSVEEDATTLNWPLSKKMYSMKVVSNNRITDKHHFQDVRLIRLECEGGVEYRSGDVAVVRPENREESVDAFFTSLSHLSPDKVVSVSQSFPDMPVPPHLSSPLSLKTLASSFWDLNASPRRYLFEVLSRLTDNELEKEKLSELASAAGQEEMFSYCTRPRRTVVEVLADFPHATASITLPFLFEILQPIRPRFFSISSPPQGKFVELLVAVVKYKTKLMKARYGLCSNWLALLKPGSVIPLSINSGSLKFPASEYLLMVGPGTGVAPFRSYIASKPEVKVKSTDEVRMNHSGEPKMEKAECPLTLVFGCRNSQGDFHFKAELVSNPTLKLFTAFSRDQPHKIYVQHAIVENSEYFYKLLFKLKCWVMVAGNAKDMPDSVKKAFVEVLIKEGKLEEKDAITYIEDMELKGMYQTETWS